MRRLLQLVHGFPPRECAGTEQYAARLAGALRGRGWEVHTLAATQAPGRAMYSRLEEPGVTRLVQNAPYAGRRSGGRDAAVDQVIAELVRVHRPDVVHLQHPASLSTSFPRGLPAGLPVVWTLHDGWAWCPAGGQRVRRDLDPPRPCAGPGSACAACASAGLRDGPGVLAALRVAGAASAALPPDRLHRLWRRLPAGVRDRVNRAPAAPLVEEQVADWRASHLGLAGACAAVLSPTRALAAEAVAQGFPPVTVVPFGVDAPAVRASPGPDAPFLFLGTLAWHKGPQLVADAHRRSGLGRRLAIHGPPGPDARYVAGLSQGGALSSVEVQRALAGAQALVVGSLWPENAPLVVLEARAAGCPVIAPAIGGIPELVSAPGDGWLYPPGDVEALADALRAADRHRPTPAPPRTFDAHVTDLVALYAGL